jgi:hypothetical protein
LVKNARVQICPFIYALSCEGIVYNEEEEEIELLMLLFMTLDEFVVEHKLL